MKAAKDSVYILVDASSSGNIKPTLLLEAFYRDVYEYQTLKRILVFNSLEKEIEMIANSIGKDEILRYLFNVLELIKKLGYNVNMSLLINQFLIDLNGGI